MISEALKIYGVHEYPGTADSPVILSWAKELGINWYYHDATPWCGLCMGVVAERAGKKVPNDLLAALSWANFGIAVTQAMLGDVLVFHRTGGGHVALYIGEDDEAYHCLGGNQSDQVDIARVPKNRLFAIRRPVYEIQPTNVRSIFVKSSGALSMNEA
jgi:uncharacterized protein (TIGR02594 family)